MHSQSNGKAPFDSERLIEEIKRYPVLYDPASDKYKNIEYKEKIWRQISLTVQAKGNKKFIHLLKNHRLIVILLFKKARDPPTSNFG